MVWLAAADRDGTVESDLDGYIRYIREIRRFPMLEAQEEYMVARRGGGDREAAHALVTSHLRLVVTMGYRRHGLPISEVISEGNVGLMKAIKRFEPEKGFRFSTYAVRLAR